MPGRTRSRDPTGASDAASASHRRATGTYIEIRVSARGNSYSMHISKDGIINKYSKSSKSRKIEIQIEPACKISDNFADKFYFKIKSIYF